MPDPLTNYIGAMSEALIVIEESGGAGATSMMARALVKAYERNQ